MDKVILEEEIRRVENDAKNSLLVKSLSKTVSEDIIYAICPDILKVVPLGKDLCRVFLSESSRRQVVKNRIAEELKDKVKVSDFNNEELISWLKKKQPLPEHLRLANCFEMPDSEGLGYFPKALKFKKLDKVEGITIVKFANHDLAKMAFYAAKKIRRPRDAEGYERPPLIATFDRCDVPRNPDVNRKRSRDVQPINLDSDSEGSSITEVVSDEDEEGLRLSILEAGKKRREADQDERRKNNDNVTKRETIPPKQRLNSSLEVSHRQTPHRSTESTSENLDISVASAPDSKVRFGNNDNPGHRVPRTSSGLKIRPIQDIAAASTSGSAENINTSLKEKAVAVEVNAAYNMSHCFNGVMTGQAAQTVMPMPSTSSVFEKYKAFDPLAESLRKIASTRATVDNSPGVGHFIDQLVSSSVTFDSLFADFATRQERLRAEWLSAMWEHLAPYNRLDPQEQAFYLQNAFKFLQQNLQNQ